jgi:hypothetical protein
LDRFGVEYLMDYQGQREGIGCMSMIAKSQVLSILRWWFQASIVGTLHE